jgi:hypothetical protein
MRTLKALARSESPNVFFVSETKRKSPRLDKLKISIGFIDYFCVDCVGHAGGLALFWKLGVDLEVIFSNPNVIISLVDSDPPESVLMLITVHRPPYLTKRRKFWELIEHIISNF